MLNSNITARVCKARAGAVGVNRGKVRARVSTQGQRRATGHPDGRTVAKSSQEKAGIQPGIHGKGRLPSWLTEKAQVCAEQVSALVSTEKPVRAEPVRIKPAM